MTCVQLLRPKYPMILPIFLRDGSSLFDSFLTSISGPEEVQYSKLMLSTSHRGQVDGI